MRKPFIWPLISIISLALIGLIFVQLYWIDNAVKLRRSRFKQNVNAALIEVAGEFERDQRLQQFRSNEELRDWMEEIGRYMRQRGYQGRIPFQQLLRSGNFDLEDPLDPRKLDSLMGLSFRERGIEAEYRFGVFDRFGEPVHLSEKSELDDLRGEEDAQDLFMVRLFPSDPFNPPKHLRVYFPQQRTYLISTMWIMLLGSAVLILLIILAFSYTIRTILRQKKLSEIKNDLIGNMTHEFKTPISTISLACEALQDPDIGDGPGKRDYIRMIQDENKRLGVLVENVLRSAVLDRGELKMKWEELDLHRLIGEALRNIRIKVEKEGGKLEQELHARNSWIIGDRIHLVNVIYNLLDNALKYSNGRPEIAVRTHGNKGSVTLEVADAGIGIKKEEQKKIFDRLYRVPTGNIHNVKGTGLGLSYVKVIVDKHDGRIEVDSQPGKGTSFRIMLPLAGNKEQQEAYTGRLSEPEPKP